MDRALFPSSVVSLRPEGPVGTAIEELGISVDYRDVRGAASAAADFSFLVRALRKKRPQLVQTWMYHADLVGGLAARLAGVGRVVWGIQASELDPRSDKTSRRVARLCAPLSRFVPDAIVSNSFSALQNHVLRGYLEPKISVIPSGFEVPKDSEDRSAIRVDLGIPTDAFVIGRAGRFSPVKDYESFVRAAGLVARTSPNVHFLLCGEGLTPANEELSGWVRAAGVTDRVHLLGRRTDMPRVYAAMDLACSSSYAEGFPSVVGEAMASGIPVVATDAGDSAHLVGDTGLVIPIRDHQALADALETFVRMSDDARRDLGQRAKARIVEQFSIESMADSYAELYQQLCGASGIG